MVEAVKAEGFAVLNADDRMTDYVSRSVQCNIIYFSQNRFNHLLLQHIKNGGMAVAVDNGYITVFWHNSVLPLLRVKDIPITFDGKAGCNIEKFPGRHKRFAGPGNTGADNKTGSGII